MTFLILLVGIFIVGTCLAFFVSPLLVDELILWLGKKRNLNYVVAIRLYVGIVLLVGAAQTAFPTAIVSLGALFVAAALLLLVFPADRIKAITELFLERSALVVRLWVMLPLLLGAFIIYSVI